MPRNRASEDDPAEAIAVRETRKKRALLGRELRGDDPFEADARMWETTAPRTGYCIRCKLFASKNDTITSSFYQI